MHAARSLPALLFGFALAGPAGAAAGIVGSSYGDRAHGGNDTNSFPDGTLRGQLTRCEQ